MTAFIICPLFPVAITSENCSVSSFSTSSADIIAGAYSSKIAYLVLYSSSRSVLVAGHVSICSFTDFISLRMTLLTSSSGILSLQPSSIAAFLAADTSEDIASFLTLSLAFIAAIMSFCNCSICMACSSCFSYFIYRLASSFCANWCRLSL